MHVYQPTITHSRTWPQTVLRWMPTFLGFPIGGFAAEIVGPIDAVAPAVVGGAITGAILGFAQWLGMRRYGPPPVRWIIATAAGLAVGLGGGRQRGRLRDQHRRTRRARRGLWCRHRRRAGHRPAPDARAGRLGVAGLVAGARGRSVGPSPPRSASTSSRSTPCSARAARSSSPPPHRSWRWPSPTARTTPA